MRIAVDLTSLAGNYSGIEQYAFHIAEALPRVGTNHDFVFLFQKEVFPPLRDASEASHVQVAIVQPRHQSKLAVSQLDVTRALKGIDADTYVFPAFPQPLTFNNPHSINVIHDASFYDCPQTLTKKSLVYWRAASRHAARNRLLVTVSKFSKARIAATMGFDAGQIAVAYDGIDRSFLVGRNTLNDDDRRNLLRKYDLPESFVLSLCTLEPRKNLPYLIEAWIQAAQANESTPDLALAGRKGWKTDSLLATVPKHLLPRIHLTGFIASEDLPHLYGLCDRFVCTSIYEGFGVPPLEALVAGAPVLCSDIEVFHETCGQAVIYFSLHNPSALADALAKPVHGISASEAETLCKRFDWQESATKILWCAEHMSP